MPNLEYIGTEGDFILTEAQYAPDIYFPLLNEAGMISSVTPFLAGDCKTGQNTYLMKDYLHKPPFSSFLPGIAGEFGIPLWAYYNNRGQGICSFGADDKDHAIMEFCPAHTAYQNNARTGFRTFLMADGEYLEAFTGCCDMEIRPSELKVFWQNAEVRTEAVYFGIPGERAAMDKLPVH